MPPLITGLCTARQRTSSCIGKQNDTVLIKESAVQFSQPAFKVRLATTEAGKTIDTGRLKAYPSIQADLPNTNVSWGVKVEHVKASYYKQGNLVTASFAGGTLPDSVSQSVPGFTGAWMPYELTTGLLASGHGILVLDISVSVIDRQYNLPPAVFYY